MAGDAEEPAEPFRCHTKRQIIHQRMKIQHLGLHQPAIKRQLNLVIGIIDQGERADGAGAHTKKLEQPVGTAKGQTVCADLLLKRLQINVTIFLGDNKIIPLLAVTKIEVLHMRSLHRPAERLGILNRAKRRMFMAGHGDTSPGERFDQRFWRGGKGVLEG